MRKMLNVDDQTETSRMGGISKHKGERKDTAGGHKDKDRELERKVTAQRGAGDLL